MASSLYPRPPILEQIPTNRHAVIEASAGTGKTFTLEHLVVELLLERRATIDEILIVTFTEKATREMRNRIRQTIQAILRAGSSPDARLIGRGTGDFWRIDDRARSILQKALVGFDRAAISTIHGFCQRVLAERAFESGSLFTQEQVDPRQAFGRAFREELRSVFRVGHPLRSAVRKLLPKKDVATIESELFAWYCERGTPKPDAPHSNGDDASDDVHALFATLVHELLPGIRSRLESTKRRRGEFDFDDLLLRLRDALRGPEGATLRATLQDTYRYALVDEFQDTDEVQWEIFRNVFFESDRGNVLFVIGDPKQAIYGFRGADVHTYRTAREAFRQHGTVVSLLENYRSTNRLIDACNAIFASGFFEGDIRYEAVRCGDETRVCLDPGGRESPAVCLAHITSTSPLRADSIRDALGEFIAREIQALVALPSSVNTSDAVWRFGPRGDERPIRYSDIHVLTRTGIEALRVGEALRRHGIPHAFFKQEGLFQTKEAEAVRDVLRAVLDPSDRSRRLRAWLTPFFGLDLDGLRWAAEIEETHPLLERLHRFKELADAHAYGALFRALLEETGLVRRLLFFEENERELTNYLHIFEILLEEAHEQRRGLAEILAQLEAYIDKRAAPPGESGNVQRLESEREAVQILTMHKAKGLEATVVFLAGGFTRGGSDDGNAPLVCHHEHQREAWLPPFPDEAKRRASEEAEEEDERLLYVALTRAKGRLYLPYFGPAPAGVSVAGLHHRYSYLHGPYRILNDRLIELVAADAVTNAPHLFEYQQASADVLRADDDRHDSRLDVWLPEPHLLEHPPNRTPEMDRLRARHAGHVITSYTRMKAMSGETYVAPEAEDEEFTAEAVDAPVAEMDATELPGGSSVGVFLHEVLETANFEQVLNHADPTAWAATDDVHAEFRAAAQRNGVPLRHLKRAQLIVHGALRAPIDVPRLSLPKGLASIGRRVAELRLHYPLPEATHPRLSEPRPSPDRWPFQVERGYVRGVVDLVFEHDERTWFLDWKSDRLTDWSDQTLTRHIERNYDLQVRLYTLGVVRMLDVRDANEYDARFGGLLYCFLRAMGNVERPSAGIYFTRPDWPTVLRWETELVRKAVS